MARVQYQRAAQASGYRPQQVDERKLARIREAGQRRLEGMQAVAEAEIRNRKEVLQAMKENEAYTKGAMKRDYQIATGNDQRIAQGLQAEAKRDQQQFNNDADARKQILDTFKTLSKTAGEEATKIYEQKRIEEFNAEVAKGMSADNLLEKAIQQQALSENGIALNTAAEEFEAKGGDPVVAAKARAQDDALAVDFTEGQIAAYWKWKYPEQRNAYLDAKAKEFGRALTADEEQYYTGEFRQIVITTMGEQTGFAAKLITPYVQQYGDQADANKFAETRRQEKKIADERVVAMSVTNVRNADPAEIPRVLRNSIDNIRRIEGYSNAWTKVEGVYELVDPRTGRYVRENVDELLNYTFIDENGQETTYLKKFGKGRYLEFLARRDKAMVDHKAAENRAYEVGRQEWLIDRLKNLSPNPTDAEVDELDAARQKLYPGWHPIEIVNLRKKDTVEAQHRANTVKRILAKNDWELTDQDNKLMDAYGTPEQKASHKTRWDSGNGSIYSSEVDKVIQNRRSIITGQNSYSDLAKAGSLPAAMLYDRRIRRKMRELLAIPKGAEGYIQGSTPIERAENAATIAANLEDVKVNDGTHGYKKKTYRNGRVEYTEIEAAMTKMDAINAHERRVAAMHEDIIKHGAQAFIDNPDSVFTDERMQAIINNPNLEPTALEYAAGAALNMSQDKLRTTFAKSKGIDFQFKDVLLEATGVAQTPELLRRTRNASSRQVEGILKSEMGMSLADSMRPGTVFYRAGAEGGVDQHTHFRRRDGKRFDLTDLDPYIYVDDRQYGRISLTALRKKTNNAGDDFDEHVARGSHGIDVGTYSGDNLYLGNGARYLPEQSVYTKNGYMAVVQLPNGDIIELFHGNKVSN